MVVVIGVGNLLMEDDGFGIHAVERMRDSDAFDGVEVVDAMTNSAAVLEAMDGHDRAIVVDAIATNDADPGTIHEIRFDPRVETMPQDVSLSVHDLHFSDAIAMARDVYDPPSDLHVVGAEPAEIDVGTDLSDPCRDALPRVVDRIRETIREE